MKTKKNLQIANSVKHFFDCHYYKVLSDVWIQNIFDANNIIIKKGQQIQHVSCNT